MPCELAASVRGHGPGVCGVSARPCMRCSDGGPANAHRAAYALTGSCRQRTATGAAAAAHGRPPRPPRRCTCGCADTRLLTGGEARAFLRPPVTWQTSMAMRRACRMSRTRQTSTPCLSVRGSVHDVPLVSPLPKGRERLPWNEAFVADQQDMCAGSAWQACCAASDWNNAPASERHACLSRAHRAAVRSQHGRECRRCA
jgi:hypothetical protein